MLDPIVPVPRPEYRGNPPAYKPRRGSLLRCRECGKRHGLVKVDLPAGAVYVCADCFKRLGRS